jgi:hypothetical protein
MSLANAADRQLGEGNPRPRDRFVWTQPDGATVFVKVIRVNGSEGIAYLRCHYGGRMWTRRHSLPLFPSMTRKEWTADDLLETL